MNARKMIVMALAVAAFAFDAGAQVGGNTISGTRFYRGATPNITGIFFPSDTVVFTNCSIWANSTGTTTQSMNGVTGVVKVVTQYSTNATSAVPLWQTNSVAITAAGGVFSFDFSITNTAIAGPKFQLTIGDGTNTAVYPVCRLSLVELL